MVLYILITNFNISVFITFFVASSILLLGYPLYFLLIYDLQAAIKEFFIDLVQAIFAYVTSLICYIKMQTYGKKHLIMNLQY